MRLFVRLLAVVLLVAIAVGIGTAVYNAGVSAGLTEAALQAAASGDPVPVVPYGYGYGPYAHGPGFGFFGIFFLILGIILVIGLVRAAVGGGRWNGPRGPGGWGGGRREMVEQWHRELHRGDSTPEERPAGT